MVTVESRLKQMQVFNLDHEVCCKTKCGCKEEITTVTKKHPKTGMEGPARVKKRHAGVVTFLAREKIPDLSDSFLKLQTVKTAIANRSLRVVSQTDASAPKQKTKTESKGKSVGKGREE